MTINHYDAFEKSVENSPTILLDNALSKRRDVEDCGLLAFETRYAEAQRKKAEKWATRQAESESSDKPTPRTNPNQMDELRRMVRERLENGYSLPFPMEIAGRYRQPFVEPGLRSEDNCVFRTIRPVIPATSGHLNRGIRPPLYSGCEA